MTVAKYLGLSRQAVSAAESGKRAITVEELLKLSNLYRLAPDALLRPRSHPTPDNLELVQRRANASGEKPLDEHDAFEIAAFMHALRTEAQRPPESGKKERPRLSLRSHGPFRPLHEVAEQVRVFSHLNSPPINVYRALSDLRVRVRMTSLNTISGAFIPAAGDRVPGVLINSSQPSDRQRFSAAHELGHCILEHAGVDEREIVSPLGRRFAPHEVEADSFASEFLVPVGMLSDEIKQAPRSGELDALVYSLADRFLVSYQAMTYRLANVSAITPSQKEALLAVRPTDVEARLKLKQRPRKAFDPKALKRICGAALPLRLLDEPDGVRQLQEFAYEEYARGVSEIERADPASSVYEKVALWVARNHQFPG
jgi:Zn-dependent peptidase ImmA (M78 family)/transcriptional regulator with XRE-family HTH domain